MLTETFLHVPGVGLKRERDLWAAGTLTWWQAFEDHVHALFTTLSGPLQRVVKESLRELDEGCFEMTASILDKSQHWRALCFRRRDDETALPLRWLALDIETTGLSAEAGQTTVVGLCGHATGFKPVALVADKADWARELPRYLVQSDVLITFNGRKFDVPFLTADLARLPLIFPPFHVDVYLLMRALGQRGGLKQQQRRLGFHRQGRLADVDGYMAVRLWREHRRGTAGARATLVRYCLDDVVVLFDLARWAYDQAALKLGKDWRCWQPPAVSLEHLPWDEGLIRRMKGRGW